MNAPLPPGLRPLVAVLESLHAPLREALTPLAHRLDSLFGPLRPRALAQGGEPNGFRGLNRRGPYHRLLLSEWALLDEAPDEFVRRAIAREHAFYELETRTPAVGLRIRAVFDAGPDQLGAPRVAQLAVLFVLLKRAIAANAELEWSVAQRPQRVHTAVDRDTVAAFLGARSNAPFVLPPLGGGPEADETWIVGPAPTPAMEPFRVLHIEESLAGDSEAVRVALHRRGRLTEELRLPLPPGFVRKRLLTEPFPPLVPVAPAPAPRPRAGPDQNQAWRPFPWGLQEPVNVRFVEGTTQLAVTFASGEMCFWSISNLPDRGPPKPRYHGAWKAEQRIASGYHGQVPFDVVVKDGAVCTTGTSAVRAPDPHVWPRIGVGGAWVIHGSVYFVDGGGTLWSAAVRGTELTVETRNVVDVRVQDQMLSALTLTTETAASFTVWDRSSTSREAKPVAPVSPGTPIRAAQFLRGRGGPWAWVSEEGDTSFCRSFFGRGPFDLAGERSAPDEQVLAVCESTQEHGARERWLRWKRGTGRFVATGADPFVVPRVPLEVTVSATGRFVAFVTAERTVELWDTETGEPRLLRHEGA